MSWLEIFNFFFRNQSIERERKIGMQIILGVKIISPFAYFHRGGFLIMQISSPGNSIVVLFFPIKWIFKSFYANEELEEFDINVKPPHPGPCLICISIAFKSTKFQFQIQGLGIFPMICVNLHNHIRRATKTTTTKKME